MDRNNELNARLIWIEVLRFISAFGIIIWHYQHFYTLENFDRSLQPFYSNPIFHLFYNSGGGGVYLFWCISGYIFFYKYRNLIRMDEGGGGVSSKVFFILRFSRLYPLHLITFILVAFFQLLFFIHNNHFFVYSQNTLLQAFNNLFLASKWFDNQPHSFNGPIWSVSVEILVYAIFFIATKNYGKYRYYEIFALCISLYLFLISDITMFKAAAYFFTGGVILFIHNNLSELVKWIICILMVCFYLFSLKYNLDYARTCIYNGSFEREYSCPAFNWKAYIGIGYFIGQFDLCFISYSFSNSTCYCTFLFLNRYRYSSV